ncbi:MAG: hypothetical protein WAZ98_10920 [Cyclobacteriaceae bacterium]
MKKYGILILLMLPGMVYSQQQPPATEIYLLDLSISKKGIALSNPRNITNHPGYDNQPSFHPDESILYYTSANAEGRTDLIEWNYETDTDRFVTQTPEREYSPTVTPDKKFISCIIQRDNGAQDLGQYPVGGGTPDILINTLTVGYHAWIDADNLLLFVLGDTLTLRKYTLSSKKESILSTKIGRSLHKIPGTSAMSFVHKAWEDVWVIKKINPDGTMEDLIHTIPGHEDLTWTPDGKIIMSDGKQLFYYQPGKPQHWREIEMPEQMPSGSISRLAVSPNGDKIAIVVTE